MKHKNCKDQSRKVKMTKKTPLLSLISLISIIALLLTNIDTIGIFVKNKINKYKNVQLFSNNENKIKVLIIPFLEISKESNQDIALTVKFKLDSLNLRDSLNLDILYFPYQITKNFNLDSVKNLSKDADLIVYGNYLNNNDRTYKINYNFYFSSRVFGKDSLISVCYNSLYTKDFFNISNEKELYYKLYITSSNVESNKGNIHMAIKYLEKSLFYYFNPDVLALIGGFYYRLGEYESSYLACNKSLEYDEDNIEALVFLTLNLSHQKKYSELIEEINQHLPSDSSCRNDKSLFYYENIIFYKAKAYYELNDYKSALNELNKVIQLNPTYVDAIYVRGIINEELKNYKPAIHDYSKVIKLDSSKNDCFLRRAKLYYEIQNFDSTIIDYNIVLKNVNNDTIINQFIAICIALNHKEEAITQFDALIKAHPNNPHLYHSRGCLHFMKNNDLALKDFNKAISLAKDNKLAYYFRGSIFLHKKKFDNAISDYNKSIKLGYKTSDVYFFRGVAYYFKNKWLKAIDDFSRSIELDNNNQGAIIYLNSAKKKLIKKIKYLKNI